MARYLTYADAEADGFEIEHEPDAQQFTVSRAGRVLGVAHYSLGGEVIDFDHTEVDPELRGTGISGILAERALTSDIVRGKSVRTSCWFMEGYVAKHPELLKR